MQHSKVFLLSETVAVSSVQHAKRLQHVAADQERQLAALQQKAAQLAEAAEAHEQQLKRCAAAHTTKLPMSGSIWVVGGASRSSWEFLPQSAA
jgi:biotin carboxyl carrier protein